MRCRTTLIFLPLLLLVCSCNNIAVKNEQCEASVQAYNRMLRWQEYESAEKAVKENMRAEFRKKLSSSDLRIADYRIKGLSCDGQKGEAEVIVEYDYYLPPSTTLRAAKDVQKWRYFEDAEPGGWRVVSPALEVLDK